MMRFQARVLTAQQTVSTLHFEAESELAARLRLQQQSLQVLSLQAREGGGLSLSRKKSSFSLLLFSQELLALLKAGLSLIEGLEGLVEKESRAESRQILNSLLDALRTGQRFSAALAAQPKYFPPLYVGLIQAAENTSNLSHTLERYIRYNQRMDEVRSKVISASLYPIILLLVGGAVTSFLIGFVVPRFASVYQGTGRSLPLLSQWLLAWGEFAGQHGTLLLSILLGGLVSLVVALRWLWSTGRLLRGLQRLPGVGERYHLYLLSRLYLTLGMLLQGGLSIIPALQNARTVVPAEWRQRLLMVEQGVAHGQQVSETFATQGLITPIAARMLRVGERTGQLGNMLQQAAEFYEGDIARYIERFMRTFEPVLMAAIGIIVGLVVVLLYMPIFDLAGSLQ